MQTTQTETNLITVIVERNNIKHHNRILAPRNLGDLLNETIIIYVRQFWRFIKLIAIVQIPVVAISATLGVNTIGYIAAQSLGLVAFVIVNAALATAIGQYYAVGSVNINECYSRVWARIVSLTLLYLLIALSSVTAYGLMLATKGGAILIVGPAIIAVIVYGSLTLQSMMLEKLKTREAISRSFGLVKRNWWRVFSFLIVIGLMGLGMAILLNTPFLLVTTITDIPSTTLTARLIQAVGALIVVVAVSPIVPIASTLLYYDLRIRKEAYDLSALTKEMGLTATEQVNSTTTVN